MTDEAQDPSPLKTLAKGALIGGLVFFVWTNISWMAIGWHNSYMSAVPDEVVFAEAIRAKIPASGLYFIPWHDGSSDWDEVRKKTEQGPFAYMMITPGGKSMSMAPFMIRSLIWNCLLALIMTWLLRQTSGLSLVGRVGFVGAVGLTGSSWLRLLRNDGGSTLILYPPIEAKSWLDLSVVKTVLKPLCFPNALMIL